MLWIKIKNKKTGGKEVGGVSECSEDAKKKEKGNV